ncbi:DUF4157 domain-containing protein [Nitriliruptor alkaliphilus]|uniref:eCIS core domain-containing protein n=1 Tax=Nitriliruptor alkaliphilus TaxID=427918 RepID=UPI000695D25B|nr:DUF4157 domain-containing protein [Nitriliruptor alkaliphilus]
MTTPDHDLEGPHHHPHRSDGTDGSETAATDLPSQLGNAAIGRIVTSGVQRSGATSAQQLDESVARAIQERRGSGQPLSEPVRRDMEGAFGHDLSDVRVHTDSTAHDLNEAVSARAFTAGNDVFFKQGTYDPSSTSGKQLLGHELTHVVQQRTGSSGLQPGQVSDPSDAAEQHAESVGHAIAQGSGPAAAAAPAAAPAVAREAEPEEEEMMMPSRDPSAPSVNREEDLEDLEGE